MADDPRNERVGGSRHYTGVGLGTVASWKCPRCSAENSGPQEQGCSACGAGAPGKHVGVPPPVPTDKEGKQLWVEVVRPIQSQTENGFRDFLNSLPMSTSAHIQPRTLELMHKAWAAAIEWYKKSHGIDQQTQPIVEPTDLVSLPRALANRIIVILEGLDGDPDHSSGLDPQELQTLVNQIREAIE